MNILKKIGKILNLILIFSVFLIIIFSVYVINTKDYSIKHERKNFKKILKSNFYLLFLLFVLVISNNMVNATSTMPSYLAFSYSWLILALINIYIYSKK